MIHFLNLREMKIATDLSYLETAERIIDMKYFCVKGLKIILNFSLSETINLFFWCFKIASYPNLSFFISLSFIFEKGVKKVNLIDYNFIERRYIMM